MSNHGERSESGRRRGQRADPGELPERIVAAARQSFAEHGWAGTTIRGVARAAGVDAALVHYYFRDKQAMLAASIRLPKTWTDRVGAAARRPMDERAAAFVRVLLTAWTDPHIGMALRSIVLTAAHEPAAREQLRVTFGQAIVGAVAEDLPAEDRAVRASLVSSQLVGLAMVRYLWRIEPLASLSDDDVVRYVAPTIHRYLAGPLD